ncbi:dr1-associated corepressor-like [Brachionus plicatilis]|uniref:Dr1-associated corepressor-like n=1 Tax=Brachionus plicatilis TaxID=10195 RepID=A0A3M7RUZ2_BRAPC|nr:dr1-associated corepressor-like [Brachionus plicatilis]
MPYKKRLIARFPPARIKKIMQMDDDVGKVSSQVPVMVSRALERFLEYIMLSSAEITTSKDAKTLTSQHILQVITNDPRLNFLKEAALKSCQMANGNQPNEAGASFSSKKEPKCTSRENTKQSEENDDESEDYE